MVRANPTGTTPRIELGSGGSTSNDCPPEANDQLGISGASVRFKIAGCVAGEATIKAIRASDSVVLETYTFTVGAGTVVTPTGSIAPSPATFTFDTLGTWHAFTLTSSETVKVVANPTGSAQRLEITNLASPTTNDCTNGAEAEDDFELASGSTINLAGCEHGAARLEIRKLSDDTVIQTYDITIPAPAPPAVPLVCEPVTGLSVTRSDGSASITWVNPTTGATATSRTIGVKKWVGGAWVHETFIAVEPGVTQKTHTGIDNNYWYTYRVMSQCTDIFGFSSWFNVASYLQRSDGPGGAVGPSEPPPPFVPAGPKDPHDEEPPAPLIP